MSDSRSTTGSHALLDGPRIAQTRLALGLSEREVTDVTGIAFLTLRAIESQEGSRRTASLITLNQLRLLAETLALPVSDLFASEPTARPEDPADAAQVTALLQHAGRAVPTELLAEALGWDLQRLRQATDDLLLSLPLTGLRLNTNRAGHVSIATALDVTGPAAQRLGELTLGYRGMTRIEAELAVLAFGRRLPTNDFKNAARRIAMGRLIRAGVLTTREAAVVPTPGLDYALNF